MSEHTSAPWAICAFPSSYSVTTPTHGGKHSGCVIASVKNRRPGVSGDPHADAHLIAAAPEMLAVLESVYVDLVDFSKRLEGAYSTGAIALASCADQVAAVIANAKGQRA